MEEYKVFSDIYIFLYFIIFSSCISNNYIMPIIFVMSICLSM
jgi:hypothetical protein